MVRWALIPENPLCTVLVHRFTGSDPAPDPHDHPWGFLTIVLWGRYTEYCRYEYHGVPFLMPRIVWGIHFRSAEHAHRVELNPDQRRPVWTLVITGPRRRKWGFYTAEGWVHWKKYVEAFEARK